MDTIVLKQEILDKIKSDPILFGKVAAELKIKPTTLPNTLKKNNPDLTRAGVLKVIREHTGIMDDSELLTELESV